MSDEYGTPPWVEQNWVLLLTLGMSGDWRWNSINHKHTRISFLKINGGDLSLIDSRCFASLRIATPAEAKQLESKIGWGLLQAPMEKDHWKELQKHPKIKDKEIKIALMGQKYFSGLGNIYAAETIYELGVHPRHLVRDLDSNKWEAINLTAHALLQKAYKLNGSSVKDFTYDGKQGQAQTILKIYGKKFCPKNHKVETIEQNKRTTWWCKECQDSLLAVL